MLTLFFFPFEKNALECASLGENASLGSKLKREVAGHSLVKHIKQMGVSLISCHENLPYPLFCVNKKAVVTAFLKLCSGQY